MGQFVKNIRETLVFRILSLIFGMFISVVLARYLGPEGYGKYSLIGLIAFCLYLASNFAFSNANIFLVGKRRFSPSQVGTGTVVVTAVSGVIAILLFGIILESTYLKEIITRKGIEHFMIWIAVLAAPILMLYDNIKSIFMGMERIRTVNILSICYSGIQLIMVMIFVVILKMGLLGAIYSYLLASFGIFILVLLYFLKSINFQRISIPSYLKESLKFSWKLHISSLAFFLIYRVDMFLIVFITNDMKALGFYAIAVGVAEKIDTIPSVIGSVLFPRVTTLERGEIRKYGPVILRITLFITGLLGLSLALLSYPLVTLLFSMKYKPSILSLCILLPGVVLLGGGRILSSELSGQGKTGIISIANSTALAINIVLNLLWIPKWGISGAAAATSVTYGTMFAIELVGASRLAGLSIFEYVIPRLRDFSEIRKRLFRVNT